MIAPTTYDTLAISNTVSATLTGSTTNNTALDILSGGKFVDGGQTINLAKDWSNAGSFTATGAVVFTGTGNHNITGASTFNNFTAIVSGATLTFQNSKTQSITAAGSL